MRVTRLLLVIAQAPVGKHKHNQNRQDDGIAPLRVSSTSSSPFSYQQTCCYGVEGCDTTLEPVVTQLSILLLCSLKKLLCNSYLVIDTLIARQSECSTRTLFAVCKMSLRGHLEHFNKGNIPKFSSSPSIMDLLYWNLLSTTIPKVEKSLVRGHLKCFS